MQISARTTFDADPGATYDLLTDKAFLEAVCVAGHSISYNVVIDGSTTTTTQELSAPDLAKNFVGATITVVQVIDWGGPAADGSRVGQLSMTIPKQPVRMSGTVTLTPAGATTVADLTGELKVNVPLLGKKLEHASEPAILAGFRKQEVVAKDWLPR
ncbi:MAG: DUF2505 domain-containing protein [Propionibacteriaceae bacterium]